ncbi:LemA protein [Proteiniborus ethanoligenes]|uniref:LemA protein n=1 Tax=Proteiniborus ethanoligenes TaxID=415015 RepID=A0A1H3Q0Q2_9FIRM|nr:LemA family protein [Proteiniborus ethanoligenes]TAH62965.1 MAG: LemA family protein [Gottschalkiaceae bacterium]SDZ06820.1 LemA protein [Proteiniborus ethanoligenes]
MKKGLMVLVIVLAIIIAFGFSIAGSYNGLVRLDEEVNAKWAQVENQLKRRADLIPNLVSTVKGFAAQEENVLLGVTEARSRLETARTPGEFAQADAQLTTALDRLNVVVESYPDLKSNENFIRLQDELAGTENRIAVSRMDYNESAKTFNSKVRSFPTNIMAGIFRFEQKEYFEINEQDKEVPKVEF